MFDQAQLRKGTLEGCILKIIDREPTYGYAIATTLRDSGFADLTEGTLYPLLLRLERKGLIAAEYRALAFTVSGYTKAQVLKKFYDELLAALEEGNSLAEFRENMNDFLEAEGYEGITPYQAENIFRTNIQTAYNVGHYKRMTEPGVKELRPYWQYVIAAKM